MSNNNNNREIVFASILIAILATGLPALNPSTSITNAGAQMYDTQYGYDNNNNNYYQDDYQQRYDDDTYSSQDYNDYGYNDDGYDSNIQLEFADKYGDNYHKDYSKHPTKDHKFVCKTGQFEGFFVKSPEFCDLEISPGAPGITEINSTNFYLVGGGRETITEAVGGVVSIAFCDEGDTAISGGFAFTGSPTEAQSGKFNFTTAFEFTNFWESAIVGTLGDTVETEAYCFDNPPLRP